MWRSKWRGVWGELKINTFSSLSLCCVSASVCIHFDPLCVYVFRALFFISGFSGCLLFLLHRISCYLLHFQICWTTDRERESSVRSCSRMFHPSIEHCWLISCPSTSIFLLLILTHLKWVFCASAFVTYSLCTLLLMLLNWNWSVNYSVGFWFLTHSRSNNADWHWQVSACNFGKIWAMREWDEWISREKKHKI